MEMSGVRGVGGPSGPGGLMTLSYAEGDSFIILNTDTLEDDTPTTISQAAPLDADSSIPTSVFDAHSSMPKFPNGSVGAVSEMLSLEEIETKMTSLAEENVTLRGALQKSNSSFKEFSENVIGWRDDMMTTLKLHKSKFEETEQFIERLKAENLRLGTENERLKADVSQKHNSLENGLKFVDSEDAIVDKLTSQLSLVEKQRREVIMDNEKLSERVESLERILKMTTEENEKLQNMVTELNEKLNNRQKLDETLNLKDMKISNLQTEMKELQSQLMKAENMKIDYLKEKDEMQTYINQLKKSIAEMKSEIRNIQSIAFQPARVSLTENSPNAGKTSELFAKIKQYDKTSSELANILNNHTKEFSTVFEIVIDQLNATCAPNCTISEIQSNLASAKQILTEHHTAIAEQNGNIKSLLTVYEEILKDHKMCLNILDDYKLNENKKSDRMVAENIELKEKLEISEKELTSLRSIVKVLQKENDEREALKMQLEVYKSDFQVERDARAAIASEKEDLLASLRNLQKQNKELIENGPGKSTNGNSKAFPKRTGPGPSASSINDWEMLDGNNATDGNYTRTTYSCPVCDKVFRTTHTLEEHVNNCLNSLS